MSATGVNVFACLVHERPDCVVDLVRNLRHLDPGSVVLLYDGSVAGTLLRDTRFDDDHVVVHPSPRPMAWGRLHDFAVDCMRFSLANLDVDMVTIVDSDQLAVRPGYSEHVRAFLSAHPDVGMLGSDARHQPRTTKVVQAAMAWREIDLWRPLLDRFPAGEANFPYWTFWPSTVFSRRAVEGIVDIFDDAQLRDIIARSRIGASEEIVLPSLVALLGHRVATNPCRYDYVRYRVPFTVRQIDTALSRRNVFWVHPVPRRLDDRLRARVRSRFGGYAPVHRPRPEVVSAPTNVLLRLPLLDQHAITGEGPLTREGADLLIGAALQSVLDRPPPHHVVVIGEAGTPAAVLLRDVMRTISPDGHVHSVDAELRPHRAGDWTEPISLLFIDAAVADDQVAALISELGGCVDADTLVASHCRGPRLAITGWTEADRAGSLTVLKRGSAPGVAPIVPSSTSAGGDLSLVSCIMPTADRRRFVPHAIRAFLAQDYADRELVVVDDGADPVDDLMPDDSRVRYIRLRRRLTIGAKRNIACEAAQGSVILHWDDDDWMASHRIRYQVDGLLGSDVDVSGLRTIWFFDPSGDRCWRYEYPAERRPWVHDATFCYRRELWATNPLPEANHGLDVRYLWQSRPKRVGVLPDPSFYVATVHTGNTSRKRTSDAWWQPRPISEVEALTGPDWIAYRESLGGPVIAGAKA